MSYNEYKIDQSGPLDKKIKEIILRSEDCIVYLDEDDTIQWGAYSEKTTIDGFGKIQNEVSYWESICNKIFDKRRAYEYKCLLAEAYARILDNEDFKAAEIIIQNTKNGILKQGKEVLKQYYIMSALSISVIIIVALGFVVFNSSFIVANLGQSKYQILLSILFGGVGSFIFTMLRLKTYDPEIVLTKDVHIIDGALRIFYGLISGLVMAICIKSNLLLGFIQNVEKSNYVFAFLGIVAGASELVVPNLIKQIKFQNE